MIWVIRLIVGIGLMFFGLAFHESYFEKMPDDEYEGEWFFGHVVLCAIGALLEIIGGFLYLLYKIF